MTRPFFAALVTATLSSVQTQAAPPLAPLSAAGAMPPSPWQVVGLPRQPMPFTAFSLVDLDGRRALRIEADRSYGNLVHALNAVPVPATAHLSWLWRVDRPLAAADLRTKTGDDTAAKVCVFFDLALAHIPFGERQLLRMARAASSDHLPGATVCYVWDNLLPVGTVLPNAYTGRMRYLVLQSGPAPVGVWQRERRDIAADFVRLFGAESAQVPPLLGVAIGADADNTGGRSLAHVADLVLQP